MSGEFGRGYRWGVASSLLVVALVMGALACVRSLAPLVAGGEYGAALFFAVLIAVPFGLFALVMRQGV